MKLCEKCGIVWDENQVTGNILFTYLPDCPMCKLKEENQKLKDELYKNSICDLHCKAIEIPDLVMKNWVVANLEQELKAKDAKIKELEGYKNQAYALTDMGMNMEKKIRELEDKLKAKEANERASRCYWHIACQNYKP